MFYYIRCGYELQGKVDRVPGLFHVATRFFTVNGIPCSRDKSYVVFESRQKRCIPIADHARSISMAYKRCVAFLAFVISIPFCAIFFPDPDYYGPDPATMGQFIICLMASILLLSLVLYLQCHKSNTNATYEQALEVVDMLPVGNGDDAFRARLRKILARQFGVITPANMADEEEMDGEDASLLFESSTMAPAPASAVAVEMSERQEQSEEHQGATIVSTMVHDDDDDDRNAKKTLTEATVLEVV